MNMPESVEQQFTPLGWEFKTAEPLSECARDTNPCKRAIEDLAGPFGGRLSWDPIAMMAAVRGVDRAHLKKYNEGYKMYVDE